MQDSKLRADAPVRAASWAVEFWNSTHRRAGFLSVFLLISLAICLTRVYIGLYGMVKYTHDVFALLDGAWRVLNGQIPHVDFYTGLGPLIYLQSAFGILLARGRAEGIGYAQGITGLICVFWTCLLCLRRLSFLVSGAMCVLIALLTVAPINVGDWPSGISTAMTYNRYGYALLCLATIEAFTGSRSGERGEMWGGLSTGAAGALMLFLKVSYFFAFVFLVLISIFLKKQTPVRWVSMLTAFGMASLLFMIYLRFHAGAMWSDLAMVAQARHLAFGEIFDRLLVNAPMDEARSALLAAFAAATVWPYHRESARKILLAVAAVNLASAFLLGTNFQVFSLPLDTAFILLAMDRVNAVCRQLSKPPVLAWAALLLGGSLCVFTSILPDLAALFLAANHQRTRSLPAKNFDAPVLTDFYSLDKDYADFVNDGFHLLKQHRRPGESIMSLDFTNPFSYGLRARPAPGGTTWLQYNVDFDDSHKPSGDELLGSADLVMLPVKNGERTLRKTVPRLYGPYLAQHFSLVGESSEWRLFRRNR